MDNDFSVDLAEIAATIRSSDVIAIRFVTVGHRLLLDFRTTEIDGPMVRVVEPVTSIEERYRSLKQMRPRFALPERIVSVWWPKFATSLTGSGVWDEVMRRVSESGHVEAVRLADDALAELVALERSLQRDAIRGVGFRTLWSAAPSRR